jgi:hypothetical protein
MSSKCRLHGSLGRLDASHEGAFRCVGLCGSCLDCRCSGTPTGIGQWSDADIVRALRVGKRPDGSTISTFMPWPASAQMTDQEMTALVLYLRSVPPRPTGTQ